MKILHRYVLKEHIGPAVMGLTVFTFILLVKNFFNIADLLINAGVDFTDVVNLFLSLIPAVLSMTLPMAILIAVLLAFGRLSADKEINAMRTSGMNLFSIFLPVILISIVISFVMILVNLYYIPTCNFTCSNLKNKIAFQIISTMSPGRVYENIGSEEGGISLFFNKSEGLIDETTGEDYNLMKEITVKYASDEKKITHIIAQSGRVIPNLDKRNIKLELFDGSIHSFDKSKPDKYSVIWFDVLDKEFPLNLDNLENGVYKKSPPEMSVKEMITYLNDENGKKKTKRKIFVDLVQRCSIPFACITFVLLGMPLGVMVHPSGKSVGFGLSFIMIAVYYWFLKRGISIGKDSNNALYTIFSIALPNLIFGIIGIFLMIRTIRK